MEVAPFWLRWLCELDGVADLHHEGVRRRRLTDGHQEPGGGLGGGQGAAGPGVVDGARGEAGGALEGAGGDDGDGLADTGGGAGDTEHQAGVGGRGLEGDDPGASW